MSLFTVKIFYFLLISLALGLVSAIFLLPVVFANYHSKTLVTVWFAYLSAPFGIAIAIYYELKPVENSLNFITTFTYSASAGIFGQDLWGKNNGDRIFFEQPIGREIIKNSLVEKHGIESVSRDLMAANIVEYVYFNTVWAIKKEIYRFDIDEIRTTQIGPNCYRLKKSNFENDYNNSGHIIGNVKIWGSEDICLPDNSVIDLDRYSLRLYSDVFDIKVETGPVLMTEQISKDYYKITVKGTVTTRLNTLYSMGPHSDRYKTWLDDIRTGITDWFRYPKSGDF